jgi:hypothetical protein
MVVLLKRISQRHIRLILEGELNLCWSGARSPAEVTLSLVALGPLVYRMKYPPLQRYADGVRICDILCRLGSLDS